MNQKSKACEKTVSVTAQRAREFALPPQGLGESDEVFRRRVSGELRDMGRIIEAHEAFSNELYDAESGAPMLGIIGAVVQKMSGKSYGASSGKEMVGDDLAVGILAQHPVQKLPLEFLLLACLMSK